MMVFQMQCARYNTVYLFQSEDLARIRNNQRRSRARQKEYVRDLEKKVREYEQMLSSQNLPDQSTVQHLRAENDSMQRLLESLGLSQTLWRQYNDHSLSHLSPLLIPVSLPTLGPEFQY